MFTKRRNDVWLVIALLVLGVLLTATMGARAQGTEGAGTEPVVTCAYRDAAGDRNLSFDWEATDTQPWFSWYSGTVTGTALLGGVRCGPRYVEWQWGEGQATPWVTWREITVAKPAP